MKETRAIIHPNNLPLLRAALRDMPGFPGMTVSKVEGFAGQHSGKADRRIKQEPGIRGHIVPQGKLQDAGSQRDDQCQTEL